MTAPGARAWWLGARPRTLWAGVVPVAVGTAVAWWSTHAGLASAPPRGGHGAPWPHALVWWRAVDALVVALALQMGANYANDYSDGVRGTDEQRAGPQRLVASGVATAGAVRLAAAVCFAVAGIAGLVLAAAVGWWLIALGASCFAAGWLYSGGPRPYGYLGLGELFVLLYFGLIATAGTVYVEVGTFPAAGLLSGVALGLVATALLEANNLRDITGDLASGKRTLAVRLGRRRGAWLYVGALVVAALAVTALAPWRPWALVALLAAPLALAPARLAAGPGEGRALLPLLGATARLQLATGALLVIGFLL